GPTIIATSCRTSCRKARSTAAAVPEGRPRPQAWTNSTSASSLPEACTASTSRRSQSVTSPGVSGPSPMSFSTPTRPTVAILIPLAMRPALAAVPVNTLASDRAPGRAHLGETMTRIAELLDKARGAVGLDNFGDDDFREGLERLIDSGDREARLNDAGRAMF